MSIEILAPVGGEESLMAAIRTGADAVYFGAGGLNARAGAGSFTGLELEKNIRICHERGIKVYVALNTLVSNREFEAALGIVRVACELSVDALIVQDIGLAGYIHKCAPAMPIHASTQTSVHTLAGLHMLAEIGFSRAVMARELSKEQLQAMAQKTPIELEVFVHGAHCMSVSGQCLMSAVLGGRSGNRGCCAQPCRLPFAADDGNGHVLSLKDLSIIDRLRELEAMGIASAKIEGRLKRAEYVAAVVSACRSVVDSGEVSRAMMEGLEAVFSRDGFTSGYYDDQRGRNMLGIRRHQDVVSATPQLLASLKRLYDQENQNIPLYPALEIKRNVPSRLTVSDRDGNSVTVTGPVAEPAVTKAVDEERVVAQLMKTGGTPFLCAEPKYDIDQGLAMPVSAVNALRREAVAGLLQKRGQRESVPFIQRTPASAPLRQTREAKPLLRAAFRSSEQARHIHADDFELLFFPLDISCEALIAMGLDLSKVGAIIPRALFGIEEAAAQKLQTLRGAGIRHVLAGCIDGVKLAAEAGMTVHGSHGMNIYNSYALETAAEMGMEDTILSAEMTLGMANAIHGSIKKGLFAYGRLPLMLVRNCPGANTCDQCDGKGSITDRRGITFPVLCNGSGSEILNSVPVQLSDKMDQLLAFDFLMLSFTTESALEVADIVSLYREGRKDMDGQFTRGLVFRGVE